jgi:hypothetical protein
VVLEFSTTEISETPKATYEGTESVEELRTFDQGNKEWKVQMARIKPPDNQGKVKI